MSALLVRHAELGGLLADVLVNGGRIVAVEPPGTVAVSAIGRGEVVDARGAALIPGLHDHHLHLFALLAADRSVDCGPRAVTNPAELAAALQRGPILEGGWVRGIEYHESVAGDIDRHRLDELIPDRPVRVQHRSGALWMLNSRALAEIGDLPTDTRVERDAAGAPTGRMFRLDAWLQGRLPTPAAPDFADLGQRLRDFGITGVTDATPDLSADALACLADAVTAGTLPPTLVLAGGPVPAVLDRGPRKILLHDHDLPDYDMLRDLVLGARSEGLTVAIHVVTRMSLVLTLAVLEDVGVLPGDRIEHGAVVPPELVERIATLGLTVVTQPGFLRSRGDDYLRDVDPEDRDHLYPHACLRAAGIGVGLSSDAPYGPLNPWAVIEAAADRRSASGRAVGADCPVSVGDALKGYLSSPTDPGGEPRVVRVGAPGDLVLLHAPLAELPSLLPDPVARVWRQGSAR